MSCQRAVGFRNGSATLAGNGDVTVVVVPCADHRRRVAPSGDLAPGFLETLAGWLLARA